MNTTYPNPQYNFRLRNKLFYAVLRSLKNSLRLFHFHAMRKIRIADLPSKGDVYFWLWQRRT
jgi:hypothetical protein